MEATDFDKFQKLCFSILAQSDNCMESQQQFRAAKTIPDLVAAWQKFWAGVLHEVPTQVVAAFTEFYDIYGKEINKAGLYYNETPDPTDTGSMAARTNPTILIGNLPASDNEFFGAITISDRARVYVIGAAIVNAHDKVMVHCNHPEAVVNLYGNATANMEQGTCHAHDRSTLIAKTGNHTSDGSATVFLSGGELTSNGHLSVVAYNNAVVHSFTKKKITLKDNAQLIMDECR